MEEVTGDCPLGATCERMEERNGKPTLVRCPWFVKVQGINPQDGTKLDHWNCAIAWMPILSVNVADQARQGVQATNDFKKSVLKSVPRVEDKG